MARIPDEEIERLRREVSLERLVEARGVKLERTGSNLVGLCPFHDDKRTPNFVVTPEKNVWHCFVCQLGGSVIDFVMKTEGASFRHAVELLRGGAQLEKGAREKVAAPKHTTRRKLEPLAERSTDDAELLSRVVAVYQSTLKESPAALAYLKRRGLEHPEVIEHFKLGYSNRMLGYRLPQSQTKLGASLRGALAELGVLRAATGHEHLCGSLVVPLFDAEGKVVQLYGRKIDDHVAAGVAKHLYLPGPHRGVFNREVIGASEEMIVCEALLDALTFWVAGYRNVTSAYGVEGVTEELVSALVEGGVKTVRIAFDRDDAGNRGAGKLSERLGAHGITTYRVWFPHGMDANEYARKVVPADKSLGLVLRQAEWMQGGAQTAGLVECAIPLLVASAASPLDQVAEPTPEETPPESETPPATSSPASEPPRAPTPAPAMSPRTPEAAGRNMERKGDDLVFRFGDRTWRVRPTGKASSLGELRVNLLVTREVAKGTRFFVDTLELYAARQRAIFAKQAAEETEVEERVIQRELGQILLELEGLRDAKTREALEPAPAPSPAMTDVELEEALGLLRDPKLLERVLEDLHAAGVVGEETNKLVSYLAATSRKLDEPLAVVIQSSSAAGKSSLMDSVLQLIPEEERVQYSAMTGQSLFYMSGQNLKHKVLAIVEEEGAERASYALKLLQSEGELTIASAGKDPATGKHVTHEYRVEGPVMIFQTTTAIDVDEELMNRCIVLAVDERREQTRAIHERQRRSRTLAGQIGVEERQRIRRLHRNAQRLLKPVRVVNPYAMELRFPDHTTRTRRDHMKYLTMISAVALLHQYQRPQKSVQHRGQTIEYIEATREDIEVATRLSHGVLGQSLDELPAQTRRLLHELEAMVTERMIAEGVDKQYVRFTRRNVREWTQWGDTQLKVHMKRLEELEYVLAHRTRGPLMHYELRYGGEGKDGRAFLLGLAYDEDRSGVEGALSAPGRASVGPRSGLGRPRGNAKGSVEKALNGTSVHAASEVTVAVCEPDSAS